MSRWKRGEADISAMLAKRELEVVTGSAADGRSLLDEAAVRLRTAQRVSDDPSAALTLAYDASRLACTALLAQQGLRPTSAGGHVAVDRAMRAQFGSGFHEFGWMRRRRNEVQYPTTAFSAVTAQEVADALRGASEMIQSASRLLDGLGFFRG